MQKWDKTTQRMTDDALINTHHGPHYPWSSA